MSTPQQQTLRWESRVERQFAVWIETEDGRRVEAEVVRRARRLLERGFRRYGIAALVEAIRYDAGISLLGDGDYRINNNHRSLLARRVMRLYPDLGEFFETRDLRGRVA